MELAIRAGRALARPRVLDLGTGSGALLLATLSELPGGWGLGIDRSPGAAQMAAHNARRLGLAMRSAFMVADWGAALADDTGFDLILANPPYIPTPHMHALEADVAGHEPHLALDGGADGLAPYPCVLAAIARHLTASGGAWLEFGTGQGEALQSLAAQAGLNAVIHADLAGRPRCLAVQHA